MSGMQVFYRGRNRGAAPYALSRLGPEDLECLQGRDFGISSQAAGKVREGRIQGIAENDAGLVVAGETISLPFIRVRVVSSERFLRVFVTQDEKAEIGEHFGLDLEKLTKPHILGRARLGKYQDRPLFTFSWGKGGRYSLSYVREEGKFRALARVNTAALADSEHKPRFDCAKFKALCEASSSEGTIEGFLMSTGGKSRKLLNLGTVKGESVKIYEGGKTKPLKERTWYWLVAEISDLEVTIKVFKTKNDSEPYGEVVFKKNEEVGGLLEPTRVIC